MPGVPVFWPRSTPPITVAQFVPSVRPRFAQVDEDSIFALVNPDPGTAKILAARLPEGSRLIHWEVSTQFWA